MSLFYGERSGGIRTYLDAKARWAADTGLLDHHVIVPGRRRGGHGPLRHEVRSLRVAASNGYRIPLGARELKATLRDLRPDAVLLHDPYWDPLGTARVGRELGALVVAVHHTSSALNAASLRGPFGLYRPVLARWFAHAYDGADAIMAACDPSRDSGGRPAALPLRFGLHPALRPGGGVRRGSHVLYVGRLAREKGVFSLVEAAARSREPWSLEIVGTGPSGGALEARVRRLGLERRVRFRPYLGDRADLARAFQRAACVVCPGEHETFGLVTLEAAASGARVVACATAPAAALVGALAETYEPGDLGEMLRAIDRARGAEPDLEAAAALGARFTWAAAFTAELSALRALRAAPEAHRDGNPSARARPGVGHRAGGRGPSALRGGRTGARTSLGAR